MSFGQIEAAGLEAWLAGLREELVSKTYRPDPVRRVMIPKPDGGGERALGIPTIRDRVAQTAAKLVLENGFIEANFIRIAALSGMPRSRRPVLPTGTYRYTSTTQLSIMPERLGAGNVIGCGAGFRRHGEDALGRDEQEFGFGIDETPD
jgi:hypothetical protein